jgi:excisionase family DNA binding protein
MLGIGPAWFVPPINEPFDFFDSCYVVPVTKIATLTHVPTAAEAKQARKALEALREGQPLVGEAAMPPGATEAMERVLEALASGDGAAVVPLDAELTTQQAADILRVSRPTLVKYLEDGTLPFRTIGVHRRIKAAELFDYIERERARQDGALNELVAINQRAGLYD